MSHLSAKLRQLTEGSRDVALPSLFNGSGCGQQRKLFASITTMQASVIWIVTFLAMLALTIFIRCSRMGRACRACAEDLKNGQPARRATASLRWHVCYRRGNGGGGERVLGQILWRD